MQATVVAGRAESDVVSGDKILFYIMTDLRRSFKELVTECV